MKSLELKNIKKNFLTQQGEIQVLKDVTFNVSQKEVVALVGQSGSGKSTLLNLIAGLDVPTLGSISVEGISYSQLNEDERTRFRGENISIVLQNFNLLSHLTAYENVSLPLTILDRKVDSEKVLDLLSQVGLSHRRDHLPTQLSGGEKQRVAIARALITEPKIILADEPSGSLDEETGLQIMDLMFTTFQKFQQTALIVTHSMEWADRCYKKLILMHGHVSESK